MNKNNFNKVGIIGTFCTPFEFHHSSTFDGQTEDFYMATIAVKRLSSTIDKIPVIISGKQLNKEEEYLNKKFQIDGSFRSYNRTDEHNHRHLELFIFVERMTPTDNDKEDINTISFNGFLTKKPVYRRTPFGRNICDAIIAVNRSFNNSDYLPCIAWERNAAICEMMDVGQFVSVTGRIQSREYIKRCEDNTEETRTVYEVSISTITTDSSPNKEGEKE